MENRNEMSLATVNTMQRSDITSFLETRRVTSKGEHAQISLTGMGTMKGKYYVSDHDYPIFLDLLHAHLFESKLRPMNLVEQRRADSAFPLLIDLDFKYPHDQALQRRFTHSHIHQFIQQYVSHLRHFYAIEERKSPLRFFVTLRPGPYEDHSKTVVNRAIKDGVHIECPDLTLSSDHQRVLRHRSLEMNDVAQAFHHTGYTNLEKDIFDEAIVKANGWFFYGESKPNIPSYTLTSVYVYDPSANEFHEESPDNYSPRQLMELLSVRYNLRHDPVAMEEKTAEEWRTRLDQCLGKKVPFAQGPEVEEDEEPRMMPIVQLTSSNVHEQLERDKIETVRKLVMECLSSARADGYQTWRDVGLCLHNVEPSEEMFNLWMDFSAKSSKAVENNQAQLKREWMRWSRTTSERQLTIRSLHQWAKEDNSKRYHEIMKESFVDYVEREVDATHTHIARLMKRMYENTYCAAIDSKKTEIYHFSSVFWEKIPQGIELRNLMTTEVAQVISDTRTKIRRRLEHLGTDERSWEETRIKKLFKIEESLYSSNFKSSVMKECEALFYVKDFAQKLNANQYLIGFKNGVVDLRTPVADQDGNISYTVTFRDARPEDYITFLAGRYETKNCEPIDYIPYDPQDTEQQKIHAEIDDFMAKLFPRPELREYMWLKLASCLEGANKEQTYETWIGVGGNGKSKLVDLMSMAFGDYASSLQSTAMTRKRPDSGAANPDIMAIRNKRFIYMAEPDDREPLNTSRMKQFTGEDDVEARGLFEDQTKFKITGKIFMLCNAFPAINTMDRGTWRRVRAVPFESKFVDPSQEDVNPKANIYARDNQLDVRMKEWRAVFMSRLVHIYKTQYMPFGLGKVPAIVTQESSKYKESFDSVAKFLNARIREIKKGGYEAPIKDIFRVYKNWYESVGGGMGRKLNQTDLYKRLADNYGEPLDKKTFKQLRLFEDDFELEEYERGLLENEGDAR
jgi:P4 family phage/plasmid primase-like protien